MGNLRASHHTFVMIKTASVSARSTLEMSAYHCGLAQGALVGGGIDDPLDESPGA